MALLGSPGFHPQSSGNPGLKRAADGGIPPVMDSRAATEGGPYVGFVGAALRGGPVWASPKDRSAFFCRSPGASQPEGLKSLCPVPRMVPSCRMAREMPWVILEWL